jgi:hypothetical protein
MIGTAQASVFTIQLIKTDAANGKNRDGHSRQVETCIIRLSLCARIDEAQFHHRGADVMNMYECEFGAYLD